MTASCRATWRLYTGVLMCAALIVTAALFFIVTYSADKTVPHEKYYRAVYILQSLGGFAADEPESIPRSIPFADATESLLHHPDKIFVLGRVAEELTQERKNIPRAALFEAYARLGLGDRREAARLLTAYVVENDYKPEQYTLLSRILRDLGDYSSLLLICREWAERDPSCRADRIRFTWLCLQNLERYGQAADYMRAEGKCLGWQAQVYAAKSIWDLGETREAEGMLESALKQHEQDTPQILRLWSQLKDKEWL